MPHYEEKLKLLVCSQITQMSNTGSKLLQNDGQL